MTEPSGHDPTKYGTLYSRRVRDRIAAASKPAKVTVNINVSKKHAAIQSPKTFKAKHLHPYKNVSTNKPKLTTTNTEGANSPYRRDPLAKNSTQKSLEKADSKISTDTSKSLEKTNIYFIETQKSLSKTNINEVEYPKSKENTGVQQSCEKADSKISTDSPKSLEKTNVYETESPKSLSNTNLKDSEIHTSKEKTNILSS